MVIEDDLVDIRNNIHNCHGYDIDDNDIDMIANEMDNSIESIDILLDHAYKAMTNTWALEGLREIFDE